MSSPIIKSVKRASSRPAARHSSTASRKRTLAGKSTGLKPATKRSAAGKAPARKATKTVSAKHKTKPKALAAKKPRAKVIIKTAKSKQSAKPRKLVRATAAPRAKKAAPVRKPSISQAKRAMVPKKVIIHPRPQPTHEEAAALRAFELAHKEFARGRFAEALGQFRSLVEKYQSVSEVAARARTYLAVSEARLRTDFALPKDADSLYDRAVIELNRGEYVAAQELFERALKREPDAAHIHYDLAATRARLGAIDLALSSLRRAVDLQPKLRIRAQRDQDLTPLRSDPEFEQLIFAPRE